MATKNLDIIFEFPRFSYAWVNRYPVAAAEEAARFNMEEEFRDVAYNDDTAPGQGKTMKRYEINACEVPEWMDAQYFIQNYTAIHAVFYGMKTRDVTEDICYKLVALREHVGEKAFYAITALLSQKTFRSAFRKSLREQIDAWFVNPNPKYPTPLSPKQIASITAYSRY